MEEPDEWSYPTEVDVWRREREEKRLRGEIGC